MTNVLDKTLHTVLVAGFDANGVINAESGVPPPAHALYDIRVNIVFVQQQFKHLFLPYFNNPVLPGLGNMDEISRLGKNTFGGYCVNANLIDLTHFRFAHYYLVRYHFWAPLIMVL